MEPGDPAFMKDANIFGIKASEESIDLFIEKGAVQIPSDEEWKSFRKAKLEELTSNNLK